MGLGLFWSVIGFIWEYPLVRISPAKPWLKGFEDYKKNA